MPMPDSGEHRSSAGASSSSSSAVPQSFRPPAAAQPPGQAAASSSSAASTATVGVNPQLSQQRISSLREDDFLNRRTKEPDIKIEGVSKPHDQDLVLSYLICACFDRRSLQ
eukprot:TRINITY_DN66530_c0_g1_i1.p1 TRINITY_DN66530_c0_g1~~TRINITY_DN66530_c0_g1_i1.p1  ORF type:complete len:124 (-),score=20.40 TRINITY_DN66530_c0_g1_i1:68-400(-)